MCIFKCFSFQINPDKNCPFGASGNAYIKTVVGKNDFFCYSSLSLCMQEGGGDRVLSGKDVWFLPNMTCLHRIMFDIQQIIYGLI